MPHPSGNPECGQPPQRVSTHYDQSRAAAHCCWEVAARSSDLFSLDLELPKSRDLQSEMAGKWAALQPGWFGVNASPVPVCVGPDAHPDGV